MLHVDMDSFFVSVELLDYSPELRGLPTAVAYDTARSCGSECQLRSPRIRSAVCDADCSRQKQLCPQLVLIDRHFEKYRAASHTVMDIFQEFTPLVEPLSIDEAFLDVAGSIRLFGPPLSIAQQLRVRVRECTGLPASVGLASTKHIAKLASQRARPTGCSRLHPSTR